MLVSATNIEMVLATISHHINLALFHLTCPAAIHDSEESFNIHDDRRTVHVKSDGFKRPPVYRKHPFLRGGKLTESVTEGKFWKINCIFSCDIPRTPHRRQAPEIPTNSVSRTTPRSNTLNSSVIGIGESWRFDILMQPICIQPQTFKPIKLQLSFILV